MNFEIAFAVFLLFALIGAITGALAKRKGYNFYHGFLRAE
jgi:hypothetical protein